MKWVLLIWFATKGNYAYVPVTVEGYSSYETCSSAGEKFVEQAKRHQPMWACITKG